MESLIVNKNERLARVEKYAEAARAESPGTLRAAYEQACRDGDEAAAADAARALRNKLLERSDKEMTLDRLGIDASSAAKLIASLTAIFTGEWARYRRALRDLPEQGGFPFEIEFPTPPDADTEEE